QVAAQFTSLFSLPMAQSGFNQSADKLERRYEVMACGTGPEAEPGAPVPLGAERNKAEMEANRPARHATARPLTAAEAHPSGQPALTIGNGDVLIAAITSCTNTSNPSVLLAAGLLAKKAVEAGLRVRPH